MSKIKKLHKVPNSTKENNSNNTTTSTCPTNCSLTLRDNELYVDDKLTSPIFYFIQSYESDNLLTCSSPSSSLSCLSSNNNLPASSCSPHLINQLGSQDLSQIEPQSNKIFKIFSYLCDNNKNLVNQVYVYHNLNLTAVMLCCYLPGRSHFLNYLLENGGDPGLKIEQLKVSVDQVKDSDEPESLEVDINSNSLLINSPREAISKNDLTERGKTDLKFADSSCLQQEEVQVGSPLTSHSNKVRQNNTEKLSAFDIATNCNNLSCLKILEKFNVKVGDSSVECLSDLLQCIG